MVDIAEAAAILTEADWKAAIDNARNRASHFVAYELALKAIAAFPEKLWFEHQAILALANAGALTGALERYHRLERDGRLETLTGVLASEFAGLGGRLFKDLAARSAGEAALRNRLKSAETYRAGYLHLGQAYLAINAASMYLAAGHPDLAREYAIIAHGRAAAETPDYWSCVTQAEALLILQEPAKAAERLRQAAALGAGRLADLASTRRQLTWVAAFSGMPAALLDNLPEPLVLSWVSCTEFPNLAALSADVAGRSVSACGPLLCAADLAVAEHLLAAGAREVNLVLPCEAEHLARDLPEIAAALPAVLGHRNVTKILVTREGGAFEPAARLLCQTQARGLAYLRAQSLAVRPKLLSPETAHPVAMPRGNADIVETMPAFALEPERIRKPHAIVFGDVRGFSKLDEASQLRFLEHIIGGFADVLGRYAATEYTETAGDGLFVVLADVVSAARCCFELLDILRPERVAASGLPAHLALRLSAHVGPLYQRHDRVIGRDKFCGMEVIRTARIEPVTRAGEIFVTEQFAASLACAAGDEFVCEYVGVQPMAKGFGDCAMYSLRRLREG
jgi:class 3 adenylate cyclase